MENVPTLSMLAAIMGMPSHFRLLWAKRKLRDSLTWERLLRVDRLGRKRTSLKPSLISASTRIVYTTYLNRLDDAVLNQLNSLNKVYKRRD
ncbi:hypothetical protein CI610_03205 [invertebrate metagenome]|uniref:Uncharacterized protein n=1 Tax=invertebrate metagenome TaxID=1711999 RepID=A0A2H9T3U6_9ZZZZ